MDWRKILWILSVVFLTSSGFNRAEAEEIPQVKNIEISPETQPWEGYPGHEEEVPELRSYEAKSLEGLLAELLKYNPELKAVVEKILALENLIDPAGSLEDPRFSFEGSNIPISPPALNRTAMTGLQIYYRQKVPWPGKLKLKKKIVRSKTEQEKQVYYEQLNQLVAKFKRTYYDYLLTSESLRIYNNTVAHLGGLEKILEARYSASEAPQQDILKNKVEISSIRQTIIELKQRKKILKARMNSLLNRPQGIELKLRTNNNQATSLVVGLNQLKNLAKLHRPWLKKNNLEIQEAEYKHSLAKKSLLPDFDFGAGWRFRQGSPGDPVAGEDFFSAGFSINLPMFAGKKQNKEIQAAIHQKRMREHLKTATTQEVLFQVESLYHELQQLQSQLKLLKSRTLPQARAAVDSSKVGYEAEENDFLNVLTNEISLLNQRLKRVVYRYEYEKKIADLEIATGLPIHLLNSMSKLEVITHDPS